MYAVNHVCVPQLTYWLEYGYFVLRDVVHAVTVTACLRRPITWSMAIVFSVRSSMLLTVKKEMHRFLFLCMHVVLFLWLWYSACWRKGHRCSAITIC